MLGRIFSRSQSPHTFNSKLYDNNTFYDSFYRDLRHCNRELHIECPFITRRRTMGMLPEFERLINGRVKVSINTRPLEEQDASILLSMPDMVNKLLEIGVEVYFTGGHHRKVAIIDRVILWEGSLNILSQNQSCEIMRRVESPIFAKEMLTFIGYR